MSIAASASLVGMSPADAVTSSGPSLGVSWIAEADLAGVTLKEGQPPVGPDQLAIDKATADRVGFEVGDQVAYVTDTGRFEGTITATVGLGDTDGFGGASIIALDLDTALDHFGADGKVDAIDIGLAEGADSEAVRAAIEDVIPDGTEVVTSAQVAEENAEGVNEPTEVLSLDQSSWVVPAGELFLLGDHRQRSADSRAFGPVPISTVIGRAFLRYWPLSTLGIIQTPSYPGVPSAS